MDILVCAVADIYVKALVPVILGSGIALQCILWNYDRISVLLLIIAVASFMGMPYPLIVYDNSQYSLMLLVTSIATFMAAMQQFEIGYVYSLSYTFIGMLALYLLIIKKGIFIIISIVIGLLQGRRM